MKSVRMGSVVDDGGGEVIQGRDEDMTNSEDKSSAKVGVQAEHSHLKLSTVTSDVDGAARLLRLAQLAEELGSSRIAEEARDLANRISEGRFYVACIGQFKRGKSTLINAPIGDPVLPVGFTPVTAVPTVIRFGDQRRARIQVGNGSWHDISISDLNQYVSEENSRLRATGCRAWSCIESSLCGLPRLKEKL